MMSIFSKLFARLHSITNPAEHAEIAQAAEAAVPGMALAARQPDVQDAFFAREAARKALKEAQVNLDAADTNFKKVVQEQDTTINDVADYLLQKNGGPIEMMRLNKLLYFAQVASLVWYNERLFPDDFMAWAGGPVPQRIWNDHRYEYKIDSVAGSASKLTERDRKICDALWKTYGDAPVYHIVQWSQAAPWKSAYDKRKHNGQRNELIDLNEAKDFYAKQWAA